MSRANWNEAQERDMLNRLSALARGVDPVTCLPVSHTEAMAAQKQYFELKNQVEQRQMQQTKLDQDFHIEQRRLDIEAERVNVQKAEVIVKALEVAANAGIDPQQLFGAIQQLGSNLLSDRSGQDRTSPLLLDKKS